MKKEKANVNGRGARQVRWRLWVYRLAATGSSVLVSLLILEMLVRIFELEDPVYPMAERAIVLYYDNPNEQVHLTPNWEGYVSGTWTQINKDGFRDAAHAPRPAPQTVRIAAVGDSYTMGDGVHLDDTYPKQMERMLRKDHSVEVLNCGISATNSAQQLGTVRDVLRDYQPDIVILGFNVNDFKEYRDTRFERLTKAGYGFTVGPDRVVAIEKDLSWLDRRKADLDASSYLWRFASKVRDAANAEPFDVVASIRQLIHDGNHLRTFAAVEQMRELCDVEGVGFRVYLLPGLVDAPSSLRNIDAYPYRAEHAMICDHFASCGVDCIDIVDAFRGKDVLDLVVSFEDRHYNEEGNRLIALAMAADLKERLRKRRD
jgi:lysophospholipase L1-like esterase